MSFFNKYQTLQDAAQSCCSLQQLAYICSQFMEPHGHRMSRLIKYRKFFSSLSIETCNPSSRARDESNIFSPNETLLHPSFNFQFPAHSYLNGLFNLPVSSSSFFRVLSVLQTITIEVLFNGFTRILLHTLRSKEKFSNFP